MNRPPVTIRLTRLACIILGVLCLAFPATLPADTITFSQLDFYQDGSLAISDSEWGAFEISYNQDGALRWINVVADPGTLDARWIVQNHPLLPAGLTGTSDFSSSSYFDLGVPRGIPAGPLNVGIVVTTTPATGAPTTFDVTAGFTLGKSQNIINSGVPSGVTTQGAPDNGNLAWNVPFVGLSGVWHLGMPNVVQEKNFCGPGAAANSLHWLNKHHQLGLNQTLTQTQTELAANMQNNHTGNWDDKELEGKKKFIDDHDLPLRVHYAGGVKLPKKQKVTWQWIEREMAKGQDIEFMTNTHWVVVEGLLTWDNIHLFAYRDDPYQHGAATTAAEKDVINKRHVWTYFDGGFTNIGNGREVLRTAVAESVVPEPSTFLLAVIGSVMLLVMRRRGGCVMSQMQSATKA